MLLLNWAFTYAKCGKGQNVHLYTYVLTSYYTKFNVLCQPDNVWISLRSDVIGEASKNKKMNSDKTCITLNNGAKMPTIGMGTWHHGPREEIDAALR